MKTEDSNILDDLVKECLADSSDWFGLGRFTPHTLVHQSLSLCGEAGELANLVKKLDRGTDKAADLLPAMQEELIDVFIYVLNIAGLLGLDLVEGYKEKRTKNLQRFGKGDVW